MKRRRKSENERGCGVSAAAKRRKRVHACTCENAPGSYYYYAYKTPIGGARRLYKGYGFFNTLINKLPFPIHIPGCNYCGPGTDLSLGAIPTHEQDRLCMKHDYAYAAYPNDLKARHAADRELIEGSWKRATAKDAKFKERATAWLVTNLMKAKLKLGLGVKRKLTNDDTNASTSTKRSSSSRKTAKDVQMPKQKRRRYG